MKHKSLTMNIEEIFGPESLPVAPSKGSPDLRRKFTRIAIPFGKHRGSSLLHVAKVDPGYLEWMTRAYNEDFFDSERIADWLESYVELFGQAALVVAQDKAGAAPLATLTDHQQDVVDELEVFIKNGAPIVRMEGGAGYGKSYATRELSRDLTLDGNIVRATAVSYVATEVLRTQLDDIGVSCATLAKTLKFEKIWIEGDEIYQFSADTPEAARAVLKKGQVLIVDECSMISDDVAQLLFDTVNKHGGKLILVGDSAQLPPVKQPTTSICCNVWPQGIATLTQPMRYADDSDLYAVEQNVRQDPWGAFHGMPEASEEVTVVSTHQDLINNYVKRYKQEPNATHRMLLFRRADVTSANTLIREALFGTNAPVIVEDERLMVLATSDFPFAETKSQDMDSVRYYSGENFLVESVEVDSYQINIGGAVHAIPHYTVKFHKRAGAVSVIFMVSDRTVDRDKFGGPEFAAACKAARDYALAEDETGRKIGNWTPYRKLMGDFVRVAYMYATSVHRAQGQTCDYAYCAPKSLATVKGIMGRALTYVAMTRARKHLTVLL